MHFSDILSQKEFERLMQGIPNFSPRGHTVFKETAVHSTAKKGTICTTAVAQYLLYLDKRAEIWYNIPTMRMV